MKNKKLCFAASSGGHFEQLLMLEPLMKEYESFILTEKTSYSSETSINTYLILQINRKEIFFIAKLFINIILTIIIFIKEKPNYVICTGVLSMIPMCILAKICGKKLIFIESFAKINTPTLTGRILYKFSDVFYVQWEEMLAIYPKAIYLGGIY